MLVCSKCGKGKNTVSFSRHKKGSSGAGGVWALRAPIHKRVQRPNLHLYKGVKYCTKCLRIVKKANQSFGLRHGTSDKAVSDSGSREPVAVV